MKSKIRIVFLVNLLIWMLVLNINASNVISNTYHITHAPSENTTLDTTFFHFKVYFAFKNKDTLNIEKEYDNSSYRLNKYVLVLVDYINELDTSVQLNFYSNKDNYNESGELTKISGKTIIFRPSKMIVCNKQFFTITLLPKETMHACLLYQPISFKDYYFSKNANDLYLFKSRFHFPVFDSWMIKRDIGYSIQYLFLLGMIFIMAIFYVLAYIYIDDKIYLYYFYYLLVTFLQVLYMSQYILSRNLAMFNFIGNSGFDEATKGLMIFFYMIFYKQVFEITKKQKAAFYSIQLLKYISLLYVAVIIIAYLFPAGWYNEQIIYGFYRIPILFLSISMMLFTFRFKKITYFQKIILAGSIVYLLFNIISTIQKTDFLINDLWVEVNALYLGITLELIFFSVALIIRVKDSFLASEALKDKLIIELQKNEEFIKNENQILESKVKERVIENKKQNELIEEQKRQTLIQNFEKEKAQIQLQALASQMNPHFIFNCMNAIQKSILTNEIEKASVLLTDFASLIRMVLQNSTQPKIALSNEIEVLEQYLKLEQNRLGTFEYAIEIDENILTDFTDIPNMMLQPLLENAIWHGFRDINYKGKIEISFIKLENLIRCTIVDNGIGRTKAASYQAISNQNKSLAINIIRDRIVLLNETNVNRNGHFEIIDLYNDHEETSGTKVIIDLLIQ